MNRSSVTLASLVSAFVVSLAAVGCGSSEPARDPSRAAEQGAVARPRQPTNEELALSEAQLARDHALEAAAVEENAEARETERLAQQRTDSPRADAPRPEQRRTKTRPTTEPSANTAAGYATRRTDTTSGTSEPEPAAAAPIEDQPKRVTAADQGNSMRDITITQDIRKAVVGDPSLSFAAKNVTVVTQGGKVTLLGKVKDKAERDNVASKAKRYAGEGRVDDRLEVKR